MGRAAKEAMPLQDLSNPADSLWPRYHLGNFWQAEVATSQERFVDYIETKQIIAPALDTLLGGPSKVFESTSQFVKGAIHEYW